MEAMKSMDQFPFEKMFQFISDYFDNYLQKQMQFLNHRLSIKTY